MTLLERITARLRGESFNDFLVLEEAIAAIREEFAAEPTDAEVERVARLLATILECDLDWESWQTEQYGRGLAGISARAGIRDYTAAATAAIAADRGQG